MCWSPTADLVAGTVVGVIAIVTVVRTRHPRDLPLACLPLLLGTHQLIEAAVWRGADGTISPGTAHLAVLLWMAIAFPLLPTYVPLAVLSTAWPRRAARLRVLPLGAVGLATSGVLAHAMATEPVHAVAMGHVLAYSLPVPDGDLLVAGYLLATLGAPLLSGDRGLRLFGLTAAVGAAVCAAVWELAFASTWCAFAALTSLTLLLWVRREQSTPGRRRGRPRSTTEPE
ncbi:DUF6629 family protein [Streptacidiphilus sp. P02-A3a]|uniref:DUF6629 family protein n=1 Tax=Streptacidiphilus sp. P02-A3a TaxID=2704468 RepID=UPI0015FCA01E|nr:DUF6629 family protein [Streptacidiphilus sp. P02-A3a]QMU71723.1 hypothetical protein GXP74_29235 [Streptacidiphilus sp. P02-A3a]